MGLCLGRQRGMAICHNTKGKDKIVTIGKRSCGSEDIGGK